MYKGKRATQKVTANAKQVSAYAVLKMIQRIIT